MGDWKERLERIKIANSNDTESRLRDKRSKCDRCGRKMSKASQYQTAAGSIVCHICRKVTNIGG